MSEETLERTEREEELAREGGTKKFTAVEGKLEGYVQMYQEMGFEVLVDVVTPKSLGQECTTCYSVTCDLYRTIYTRPKKN